jgi:hypothetical protein
MFKCPPDIGRLLNESSFFEVFKQPNSSAFPKFNIPLPENEDDQSRVSEDVQLPRPEALSCLEALAWEILFYAVSRNFGSQIGLSRTILGFLPNDNKHKNDNDNASN